MGRRKAKKFKPKVGEGASKDKDAAISRPLQELDLTKRERYFEIFVAAALLAFGLYQSILYFGHKVVPISDFPAIIRVGHELLSFKLPSTFKMAPVTGLLQACLSHLVGGRNPDLTAAWLLNAILHPFNLLLFWLIGKRILAKSAVWFAIVAIITPWVLYMLREPLIETTLLFFLLLSIYLILTNSRWRYLLASITTLVRYEGSALIMAAFVMDVIHSRDKRQWIKAFIYSAIASVPLIVWLLGTALVWRSGTSHYFNVLFAKEYAKGLAGSVEARTGMVLHMKLLWQVGFRPLFAPYPGAGKDFAEFVWRLSKVGAVATFFFGSVYGLYKRNWNILVLLIFFVPYFLLHATYPYPLQRYHTNIFWIAMFICWFGLQSAWRIINKNHRIPAAIVIAFQILIVITAGIWLFKLLPSLPKIATMSPRSASVPYVAIGLAALILGVRAFAFRPGLLLQKTAILTVFALVVVSNQFMLVSLLGDGQRDREFVDLARWYSENARPGEKLVVYMSGVVEMFAPKRAGYIVGFPKAESPAELVEALYEEDVTYVVWASREGLNPTHTGYRRLNLHENITLLGKPRSIGPYEFITQLGSRRGYVNVFRLRTRSEGFD
jgi:hypothetical protein